MTKHSTLVLTAISLGLVAFGLFYARLGFFIIDEVIYLFAADTLRVSGSLILDNGFGLSQSGDLIWSNLLSVGPDGLTSQYPAGSAFFWAPLMDAFGERAVILTNVLAMVLTLFATRAVAMQLFDDKSVALGACLLLLFGSFTLEYAFVYWPHMISVCSVTVSFLLFLKALDADRSALWLAAASGLALGAGVVFRLDNVLALPAFAILAVLFAARPIWIFAGGAAGLAPALGLLAITNQIKFGTWNPVSYGPKGGLVDAAGYLPFAVIVLALLAGLFLVRFRQVKPRWFILGTLALVAAIAAVPFLRNLAINYSTGVMTLFVDARGLTSPYTGVQAMPDGTQLFWGLAKKALGQSMPWIGLLLILTSGRAWKTHQRSIACVLILFAVFSFPFLVRSWHGGMSSNMRYFLPVLPVLATMISYLIAEMFKYGQMASRMFGFAILAGFLAALIWMSYLPTGLAGAHQILSLYVFLAVALASLLVAHVRTEPVVQTLLVVAGIGIGVSVFNTLSDTFVSQLRREAGRVQSDTTQGFDGKVLIYGQMMRSALLDPDQIVAVPQFGQGGPDIKLVEAAIDGGYRVLMTDGWAETFLASHPGFRGQEADGPVAVVEVVRAE